MNTLFLKNICCDDVPGSAGECFIPEGHGAAHAPGPRARCKKMPEKSRARKLFKESFKAREEDKTALSSKAMHNNIPYNHVKHIFRGVGNARH